MKMMNVSETLGGIESAAKSAVPVFEKTLPSTLRDDLGPALLAKGQITLSLEVSPSGKAREVEVTEILIVDDLANRECTPNFNPGIPDEFLIEYVPKTEPPEDVFKRLKSEAFQKVE